MRPTAGGEDRGEKQFERVPAVGREAGPRQWQWWKVNHAGRSLQRSTQAGTGAVAPMRRRSFTKADPGAGAASKHAMHRTQPKMHTTQPRQQQQQEGYPGATHGRRAAWRWAPPGCARPASCRRPARRSAVKSKQVKEQEVRSRRVEARMHVVARRAALQLRGGQGRCAA